MSNGPHVPMIPTGEKSSWNAKINDRVFENINIDSNSTQRIQEMHILIGHIICDLIESNYIS